MDTINAILESLFKEEWEPKLKDDINVQQWGASTGGVFFTTDGIMNADSLSEEEWFDHNKARVAFILKDQHQALDIYGHHSPDNVRNYVINDEPFFVNLRNLFWGLSHTTKQNPCTWDTILENKENVKDYFLKAPYALIEAKKTPGGGKLDDKILNCHLHNFGDLLWKEIKILNPNIIVCCNQHIFKFILQKYQEEHSLCIFKDNGYVCYDEINKVFILPAYHPSDKWKGSIEQHFNFVLNNNHFNSVLKLIPDDKLPEFLL